MRTKKVTRYYCDFCRKGMFRRNAMLFHEASCISNPNRKCNLCSDWNPTSIPLSELIEISFGIGKGTVEEQKSGLDALRDACNGCPVCMLAAMRQSNKDCPEEDRVWVHFDYLKEKDRFLRENETQPGFAGEPI